MFGCEGTTFLPKIVKNGSKKVLKARILFNFRYFGFKKRDNNDF
jgi:hypothetical protein